MPSNLDESRLKAMVIALWRRGGMDTLVKVMPKGSVPASARMAGYCSSFKFVVGRTPMEMEAILGFAADTKLRAGAEIFLVRPLPNPQQFSLRGYSQLPGGMATNDPGYVPHPAYPPGLGAPQWELTDYPQAGLRHLATVLPGQRFTYRVADLPPPI